MPLCAKDVLDCVSERVKLGVPAPDPHLCAVVVFHHNLVHIVLATFPPLLCRRYGKVTDLLDAQAHCTRDQGEEKEERDEEEEKEEREIYPHTHTTHDTQETQDTRLWPLQTTSSRCKKKTNTSWLSLLPEWRFVGRVAKFRQLGGAFAHHHH